VREQTDVENEAVLASAPLLDALGDLARLATSVRGGWSGMDPAGRRAGLRAVAEAAERVTTMGSHLTADVVALDPDPEVLPDAVIAVPDEASGDVPLGDEVFDRVLGIVAAAGGLDEVLDYLIGEVRPHKAPIEEAIAAFRLDRTRGPYAERAVQLLEAALRTGLFR
jgi:hypothetical protein